MKTPIPRSLAITNGISGLQIVSSEAL
eukprot:SAG31_NODE_21487_length_548_cov_1.071269_1_plen_26_part_10